MTTTSKIVTLRRIVWKTLYSSKQDERDFVEKRIRAHYIIKKLAKRGVEEAKIKDTPWHGESGKASSGGHITVNFEAPTNKKTPIITHHVYKTNKAQNSCSHSRPNGLQHPDDFDLNRYPLPRALPLALPRSRSRSPSPSFSPLPMCYHSRPRLPPLSPASPRSLALTSPSPHAPCLPDLDLVRTQRLEKSTQMAEWSTKVRDFQLDQERRRATIHVKEKRAKLPTSKKIRTRTAALIDSHPSSTHRPAGQIRQPEPCAHFYRGEYLQLLDANQDNYLEECLKICNVLAKFEEYWVNSQSPYAQWGQKEFKATPVAIVDVCTLAGLGRRQAALQRSRLPRRDVHGYMWQRVESTEILHLNEDIYAGMNVFGRGGRIMHTKYYQCGKGEQMLSRKYFYLGRQLPIAHFLSSTRAAYFPH
ncbi:1,3-beta-glucan synthase component domain containing protein [Lactarius tabidus]